MQPSSAPRPGRGCLTSLVIYLALVMALSAFAAPFDWLLALELNIQPGILVIASLILSLLLSWVIFLQSTYPQSPLAQRLRARWEGAAAVLRRRRAAVIVAAILLTTLACLLWMSIETRVTTDPRYQATTTEQSRRATATAQPRP